MEVMDVVITAIYRPTCLRLCLTMFEEMVMVPNAEQFTFRALLNTDPFAGTNRARPTAEELDGLEQIVQKFMPVAARRTPAKPSFTKALGWCWANSTSRFVFHLEDDWGFCKPTPLKECCNYLSVNQHLSGIALDRCKNSFAGKEKDRRVVAYSCKEVLIRKSDIHGPPAVLNGTYAREVGEVFLRSKRDVRPKHMGRKDPHVQRVYNEWPFSAVYLGSDGTGRYTYDMGRPWQERTNTRIQKK